MFLQLYVSCDMCHRLHNGVLSVGNNFTSIVVLGPCITINITVSLFPVVPSCCFLFSLCLSSKISCHLHDLNSSKGHSSYDDVNLWSCDQRLYFKKTEDRRSIKHKQTPPCSYYVHTIATDNTILNLLNK